MKKFILIDGNALVHRAFHALPPTMTTKDGKVVNAVYGFTAILLKALKDIKPEYIALTFDVSRKTFRDAIYAEYKATRTKQPDELYAQFPLIKEVVAAFQIPIYEKEGFEADDVIGTICSLPEVNNNAIETIIVTGDMDTLQLVDENTKVLTLRKGVTDTIIYDETQVRERFGFAPEQIIDYKALRGDASDNIPGVRGIGEKTAVQLIRDFGSLEAVYRYIETAKDTSEKIKERYVKLLRENKDEAFMSKQLATIVTDVPFPFNLDACKVVPIDRERVMKLFSELEFRSLMNRIPEEKSTEQGALFQIANLKKNFKYRVITEKKAFDAFFAKLKKQKRFTFDTETTGLNTIYASLLGIAFSWKEREAFYVSVDDYPDALDTLRPIFENASVKKSAHNMKYDYQILYNHGVRVNGVYFDSMIASYLLAAGSRSHSLDNLAFSEFGHEMVKLLSIAPKGRKGELNMRAIPVDTLGTYSCEDADFTERLVRKYEPLIKKEGLSEVFFNIEMPLLAVLSEMEVDGIRVDVPFLKQFSKKLKDDLKKIDTEIFQIAGKKFNIDSPVQLKTVLFDTLDLPTKGLRMKKTGISTGADVLEKLKDESPIIGLISRHRELAKLKSTYTDAIPRLVNKKTGRVHTHFNQTVASTGRLSSSNPNLQNIPVRTELGARVRRAFIANEGYKILACDYSQIELRIVAHVANDKNLIEIFKRGEDVHAATAARVNHVPIEQVTKEMRYAAKTVNFGVLYGQGPRALAEQTGMTLPEAKDFIRKYFETFSAVREYIEETKQLAHELGYVETLTGRRRMIPELHSTMPMLRASGERMAVNTPIQGTAADMIKIAMIRIAHRLHSARTSAHVRAHDAHMLLQVHDELVLEVRESSVKHIAKMVREEMESAMKLRVPIKVDAKFGNNWSEMKPV